MKSLQYILLISSIVVSLIPTYHGVEIIGGHKVKPHSKPYMVSIQVDKKNGHYEHKCGGALIRSRWVLTAAHCQILSKQPIQVVLGAHNLSQIEKSQEKFLVKKQHPHPDFDRKSPKNDIMLLELASEAKINKNVKVLKLPKNKVANLKNGTPCTVAGWGITTINSTSPSDTLKGVKLYVIDHKTCNSKDYYNHNPVVTPDMICVGDRKGREDTCKGDSGSPLICKGLYTGIVSYGPKCTDPKQPGIYTLISKKYLKWIRKIIDMHTYNMTTEDFFEF